MRRSVIAAVLPLLAVASTVPAARAEAAPTAVPARAALKAAPGARVKLTVAVRDVARCAITASRRTTSVPAAGSRAVTFVFRVGRRAPAGVHSLRVTCPPAAARTIRLRIRRTAANRRAGALLSGPIVARAVRPSTASTTVRPTPPVHPTPARPTPAARRTPAAAAPPVKKAPIRTSTPVPSAPALQAPSTTAPTTAVDSTPTGASAEGFTTRQGAGTLTTLDATSFQAVGLVSTGGLSYAWEIDGSRGPTGAVAQIQPTVGVHRVKLTVTDAEGHSASVQRDVAVVWRGWPYTAQLDNTNGFAGGGALLPQLTQALSATGPWRTVSCLNNGYGYRPQVDGSVILEVHQGDHPGTTGGDRCGLGINEAYDPYVDVNGNADGLPRFYRVSFMLDPSLAGVDLHDVFNNFMEWHGKASGGSVLKIGVDVSGTKFRVYYTKMLQGVAQPSIKIDEHPLVPGAWQNYVVEARWSANSAVGYVRVYRDGVCETCGVPQADAEGRIFGETLKQLQGGSFEAMAFAIQNYRQPGNRQVTGAPAGTTEPLPDTAVHYRDVEIGPTLASVTAAP